MEQTPRGYRIPSGDDFVAQSLQYFKDTILAIDYDISNLESGSSGGGGSGSGEITIQEQDGLPKVTNVNTIRVSNGTLVDEGNGIVTLVLANNNSSEVSPGKVFQRIPTDFNVDSQGAFSDLVHNLGQDIVTVTIMDSSKQLIDVMGVEFLNATTCRIRFPVVPSTSLKVLCGTGGGLTEEDVLKIATKKALIFG